MTNCINCGAPLHGSKCAYCDTEYSNGAAIANFQSNDYTGTLNIDGEEIGVYIAKMEANSIELDCWTDADGVIHRSKPRMKRKFTLIEI